MVAAVGVAFRLLNWPGGVPDPLGQGIPPWHSLSFPRGSSKTPPSCEFSKILTLLPPNPQNGQGEGFMRV